MRTMKKGVLVYQNLAEFTGEKCMPNYIFVNHFLGDFVEVI
jgi:hypothetical protein